MAKTAEERFRDLMARMGSPEVVSAIDEEFAILRREYEQAYIAACADLIDIRKLAARTYKINSPPPDLSFGVRESAPLPPPEPPKTSRSDLTLWSLAAQYRAHGESPYHELRHATKGNYDSLISRLLDDHGHERLDELEASDIRGFYEDWVEGGKLAIGHSLIGMLRILVNFGANVLNDWECARVAVALHNMRFTSVKARTERLSTAQADLIRAKAHEMGHHSIALAQALQFEFGLRQKDVIGEWVPETEARDGIVYEGEGKWTGGICWQQMDDNFVLRHTTSFDQKQIAIDLSKSSKVMTEINRPGVRQPFGPIIINEQTGKPYTAVGFRRAWRKIATAASIPSTVRNSDSRRPDTDDDTPGASPEKPKRKDKSSGRGMSH